MSLRSLPSSAEPGRNGTPGEASTPALGLSDAAGKIQARSRQPGGQESRHSLVGYRTVWKSAEGSAQTTRDIHPDGLQPLYAKSKLRFEETRPLSHRSPTPPASFAGAELTRMRHALCRTP